ncbi:MAG: TlyA family rRNA (cytidine-2'-O)-methyltransferase [Phycisphaerales bacterium]|nr:TlyA family rRNA (cytidine-2'-O)-methyltransferase [Phycisphaerales bacterium]
MTDPGSHHPAADDDGSRYVGRGALKLRAALDAFRIDPSEGGGLRCADFGANVGGFTDCLLQTGAGHVWAVDTSYGTLAYKLRIHPKVTVLERTNALHAPPPDDGPVDLMAIDLGWTPQRLAIPAALRWVAGSGRPGGPRIISLIKPHYEATDMGREGLLEGGVLSQPRSEEVLQGVLAQLPGLGVLILGLIPSPIPGGGKHAKRGNAEWLVLLRPC